jgi:putative membrane protein
MSSELRASFNELIKPYLVLTIGIAIASSVIGIPLALIWFLGVGQWWARHYFEKLECHLDEKTLRYRKGILVSVEKTIPLENIQDVTFIEGPLLRRFHLSTLKFETAGHSVGQANDMHLTGIIDAHEFRNRILEHREALKQKNAPHALPGGTQTDDQIALLQSIDRKLEQLIEVMKNRA